MSQIQYTQGDIVQLFFDGVKFVHTLFAVDNVGGKILVATHTFDEAV